MGRGISGKKWLVEVERRESFLVEIEADDWSDARNKGHHLAFHHRNLSSNIKTKVRIDVEVHANLDGKFSAYMYDLHGPGDILLVEAPIGGTFDEGSQQHFIKLAKDSGIVVHEAWNGVPGCENMSIRVALRPSKEQIQKFNELLAAEVVGYPNAERARFNHG